MMQTAERIDALVQLGDWLRSEPESLKAVSHLAFIHNGWFNEEQSLKALRGIAEQFLQREALEAWIAPYIFDRGEGRRVGLVLAGNIPAVGFHDILATFVAGHTALIKYSEKDKQLIPFLLNQLAEVDPCTAPYFEKIDRLTDFDAVIATGSNNSARYFEQYFQKYPHIIRRNRNGVSVLNGKEDEQALKGFAEDVFSYYGLGCRSTSKVYVPKGYDLTPLMALLDEFKAVMNHNNKYKNNYDFNRSIFLLNQVEHLANDCIMLLERDDLLSRIATIHYAFYDDLESLTAELQAQREDIQCIGANFDLPGVKTQALGQAQHPALDDYADGVNTLAFLQKIALQ